MQKKIFLILIIGAILCLNNCKKSSKNKFTTITVGYTTNITQSQCSDGNDAFNCIYLDIIDPGVGRVSRNVIYNLNSTGSLKLEMGPQTNPEYCAGSKGECTDSDRIHYQKGKTYEFKAYLVCKCASIGECGNNFQFLSDGTFSPVKLFKSGSIQLDEKDETNQMKISLSN
jgi:hypothetical protein